MKKSENKASDTEPQSAAGEFSFSLEKNRAVSAGGKKIWKLCLYIAGGSLLVWIFRFWLGFSQPVPVWLAALAAGGAWLSAIWMLLTDTKAKWFWIIWLSAGFCFLLIFGKDESGVIIGVTFSFIFLLFRKYKPYMHLMPKQKAGLFIMGILIFFLLTFGFIPFKSVEAGLGAGETASKAGNLLIFGRNLTYYALDSIRIFWFVSLFQLFVRIRLHFLRMRSKLAVITLLVAGVPLFLLATMGVLTLYATLGETQAARARSVLDHWEELYEKNTSVMNHLSASTFSWRQGEPLSPSLEKRLPVLLQLIVTQPEKAEIIRNHNPGYYLFQSEIWLLKFDDLDSSRPIIHGGRMDQMMLDKLADIIHSDIRLSFSNPFTLRGGGEEEVKSVVIEDDSAMGSLYGRYLDISGAETKLPWWREPLYFGMNHLQVVSYQENEIQELNILLLLENSVAGIIEELTSDRNLMSQVVLAVLSVLAILMLILEFFALFFGIRITSGLTTAVRRLYKGTREIASGNLNTRIDIPNEDELGDLAHAFNEMVVAVKEGKEQAVIRERLESELKTARKIQEKLLPHEMPDMPGYQIAGTSIPSLQVGGDYFDFLDLGAGRRGVAIADVSGKGIPAALLMANLQASLHAQVLQNLNVVQLASQMNELLVKSTDENMFVTFFFGVLDRKESLFTAVNAGHNPPILLRQNGELKRLKSSGMILGFMKDQKYKKLSVSLEKDDLLVLFTDGVTEAAAPGKEKPREFFGEERLIDVLRSCRHGDAQMIQAAVLEAVTRFAGGAPQEDDITLIIIKRI
jgi:serine phosphatase RsbU (regulator of sigma subunit)